MNTLGIIMTREEYITLMKFHLLMTSMDLTLFNYAAVDKNGELYIYIDKPTIKHVDIEINKIRMWYNNFAHDEIHSCGYELVTCLIPQPYWKESLVKL